MDKIKVRTIKEQAYDIIKKKILSQEYGFGERINLGKLSEELGISNSPIREALGQLEQDGLVRYTPNSGYHVVEMTQRDYFEQSQMLYFWIKGSYDFLYQYDMTDSLVTKMEKCLATQKEYLRKKDAYHFTYYADLFDRCIIEATGNQRLLKQFDSIFPLFFLGSLYDHQQSDTDWQIGVAQHERILNAIRAKNHDEAVAALREHYFKHSWSDGFLY